jgi:hypothetical protein
MIVPVHWYYLPLGQVPTFSTDGRFLTFAENFHVTLWAGGDGLNPVGQSFKSTPNDNLEWVVTKYLEAAVRRVQHLFHGTLHGVIFRLGCDETLLVRNEIGGVVEFINGEYTSMELGLAYSQVEARAEFQYMNIGDLNINLPLEVNSDPKYPSRYERPTVI